MTRAGLLFRKAAAFIAAALLTSCGGRQSAVNAAGVQAERLENLWWLFLAITTVVYMMVMLVLIIAWAKRCKARSHDRPDPPNPARERRAGNVIKGAVAITVVVIFSLMITSFRTGRALNSLAATPPHVNIKVTGHQWWWEVEYTDVSSPSTNILTANEIHVPVGRPIRLDLQSNDVIHSLWMPNLHGKRDLIPTEPTTMFFQADTPGTYWGQCAEFCGFQHAKMRFQVIAESDEDFAAWINSGRQKPSPPATAAETRGQQIFTTGVCAQCHTVQGTGANGRVGPNLTHVASRPYIAAGSLQNTPENLALWVTDPQKIKPGIRMPMNQFSDEDLNALVAYLRSLK